MSYFYGCLFIRPFVNKQDEWKWWEQKFRTTQLKKTNDNKLIDLPTEWKNWCEDRKIIIIITNKSAGSGLSIVSIFLFLHRKIHCNVLWLLKWQINCWISGNENDGWWLNLNYFLIAQKIKAALVPFHFK